MRPVAIIGIGQTKIDEQWNASIRQIAAQAIRAGHDVKVLNVSAHPWPEVEAAVRATHVQGHGNSGTGTPIAPASSSITATSVFWSRLAELVMRTSEPVKVFSSFACSASTSADQGELR